MKQVEYKIKLSKKELDNISKTYLLGSLKKHVFFKQGNINSNYYMETSKGKYVLRIYNFKTKKEIQGELDLLLYLRKKKFPSPRPVGNITTFKNKFVMVFEYIEGTNTVNVNVNLIGKLGALTGKLHKLTTNYEFINKREGEGLKVIKKYLKREKSIILKSKFKDSKTFLEFVDKELNKIKLDNKLPKGLAHADIKDENLLLKNKKITGLIDFDNSYIDTFVVDIGSCLMWWCIDNNKLNEKKAKVFLKEYNKVRKLSSAEKNQMIEALKFNLLKQAFKYAYICLPRLKFGEAKAYYFVKVYKNLLKTEQSLKLF
ncbi:MAG: homoserine kinase [archaeon]